MHDPAAEASSARAAASFLNADAALKEVALTKELGGATVSLEPVGVAGLAGYVSGTDAERANRVASQIIAGRVMVNGFRDATMAPFGGCKQSGIGREYGVYGIEAYLETRALFPSPPGDRSDNQLWKTGPR